MTRQEYEEAERERLRQMSLEDCVDALLQTVREPDQEQGNDN